MKNISVVGLGKLGACTASCLAYRGFQTLGVDINKEFVDAINAGSAPVVEPRLQELISSSEGRLRATDNYDEVVARTDVTLIVVPTPSNDDGHFSDRYLCQVLEQLSASLKVSDKDYHLIVITSTVSPKTCQNSLIPLVEKLSGRRLNEGFGFCYNPEFIALGAVVNDTLNPDLVLIGESDQKAGDILDEIYQQMTENEPLVSRMSIVSAEITKIALNSFVTMKISFANTLANICEQIEGSDVDDITSALGADRRISPYYLKGGIAFGGPCFPRDNRAFAKFAEEHGLNTPLAKGTDQVNQHQSEHLSSIVAQNVKEGDSVGILGLSYKPHTPVVEESPALMLIDLLLKRNIKINVYDSLAIENTQAIYQDKVSYKLSKETCIAESDVIVVTTLDAEFKDLEIPANKDITIIDCWRMFQKEKLTDNVKYFAIGGSSSS